MATFLVTGANRGIGLEYCRQIKSRGDDVVAVCRQASDELHGLGVRVEDGLELSDSRAIDDLVQRLDGLPLDSVILNAGILQSMGLMDLDPAGIRRQFEVNALAPLLLARALVDQMPGGAKLVLMTSRMGSIDDNSLEAHWLSDVEGGPQHGRKIVVYRSGTAGHCRGDFASRIGAHPHDSVQSKRDIPQQAVQGLLARSMA